MKNEIVKLSFNFSLEVIDVYKYLVGKKEFVMSKQLLRAGTSIGANVAEAQVAQTKPDFITKMSIASKEARETKYWTQLLKQSGYLTDYHNYESLDEQICSIINIITKIVKTSQNTLSSKK